MTQSALSVVIRELEAEVGLRLLDRTTRSVLITDAGREFLKSAHRVLAELECGVRDARDLVVRQQGQVTFGVPPMAAATFVPDLLTRLRDVHPGIRVVLRDIRPDEIAAGTTTGELDFGLGTFDSTLEPLRRTVLERQPFMLVCALDHPLAASAVVRWSDLRLEPLITIAHDNTVRRLLDHAFGQSGYVVRPAYEVYNALTVLSLVEAGFGIAVLPSWARAGLRLYGLCLKDIEEPVVTTELVLISRPERHPSAVMQQFEAFVKSYVAAMEYPATGVDAPARDSKPAGARPNRKAR